MKIFVLVIVIIFVVIFLLIFALVASDTVPRLLCILARASGVLWDSLVIQRVKHLPAMWET